MFGIRVPGERFNFVRVWSNNWFELFFVEIRSTWWKLFYFVLLVR